MIAELRKFRQKEGENLPQAWERFNLTQRRCPFFRMDENDLMYIFYNGLTESSKSYLERYCAKLSG
jgi:hypothetical protein